MQTYNIITHRPVVPEPEPAPRRTKPVDSRQQFNIVSNLDHSIHHYAPPDERPKVEFPPARRLLKSAAPLTEKRSYDVLTNKCVCPECAFSAVRCWVFTAAVTLALVLHGR